MLKLKIVNSFPDNYFRSGDHKFQRHKQIMRGDYISALIVVGLTMNQVSTHIITLTKIKKRKKSYFFARKSAEKRIKIKLSEHEWGESL